MSKDGIDASRQRDPRMTLRLRLVVALLVLATAGLCVFGVATYGFYSRSQHQRLDDQLREAARPARAVLANAARQAPQGTQIDPNPPGGPTRDPRAFPGNAYGEIRSPAGVLLAGAPLFDSTSSARPALDAVLVPPASGSTYFDTGSVDGSTRWRVYVERGGFDGLITVVATPLSEVSSSLRRLALIETLGGTALLAILAVGSWFILRRGLRPLEQMATSARSISAGALDQRVSPSDPRTEVGQLGLALNTMLGELEVAFRERDETEVRLRQFLADASHELRTPLTSIQGFAELFRLDPSGERVDLPVVLRRIEEESARMEALVSELLLLARLDQTRPVRREPVDLAVLAADACSHAAAVAPDRPVTLDVPEPVVVLGDDEHLRRAISNLVVNAVKHTPPSTAIEVRVARDDDDATVMVRDHGDGLDDEALARVFDRFWRADSARVGTGAGLGLSIAAAIAREHGGAVEAANAPGGGAAFTIRIPLPPSG